MLNCFMCKTTHNSSNYKDCDNLITILINPYKNKKYIIDETLNPNTNELMCTICNKILSSKLNLSIHLKSKICQKEPNKCKKCNKEFTDKRSLQYHINKNVCGKYTKDEIFNANNIIKTTTINTNNSNNISNSNNVLNNLNQKIDNQNNQTIGTQNNIQINVNPEAVQLLPFRDVSYKIPTKKYLEYANNPEQAIKKFVKDNHFNPLKPERMNILNTNPRSNKAQLFDFDDDYNCIWQMKDKTIIAELLYDRGVNALFFAKTMLSAAGVKLDPKKETQLNAKIKEYENNEKVKKKYVDMITDLTYDYRSIVKSNKKKIESQNLLLNK